MNITAILVAFATAFLAESLTEYLFASWIDWLKKRYPILTEIEPLRYVAALVGVGLAFAYSIDLLLAAFGVASHPAWVGNVLSGLAIGRGANYVHDFAQRYLLAQDT